MTFIGKGTIFNLKYHLSLILHLDNQLDILFFPEIAEVSLKLNLRFPIKFVTQKNYSGYPITRLLQYSNGRKLNVR